MTAVGSPLKLRLFLEGCEVPVVAATINSQKNAAAVASIQIPANDYALDFKPRTLVHLFAYDPYRGAPPADQVWVGGAGIKTSIDPDSKPKIPSAEAPAPDPALVEMDLQNGNYKLIFGGEVVGVSYQKTPNSRGVSLQCVDWSSYWDIAFQYQVSGMSLGGGGIKAAFTGASTTLFTEFFEKDGDIVTRLLKTAPKSYPKMKGTLIGGLMHIIEAVGGTYFGKNAVKGTNDFFTLAEMRLHLTQMIGADEGSVENEARLLSAHGFASLFSKSLGGLGQLVTIRAVLLALQRWIFHEIVPITAPYYIPSEAAPSAQKELIPLAADPQTAPLVKTADTLRRSAIDLLTRQSNNRSPEESALQNKGRGGLFKEIVGYASLAGEAWRKARALALKTGGSLAGSGLPVVAATFETASSQFTQLLNYTRQQGGTYALPLHPTADSQDVISTLQGIADSMQRVLDAQVQRPVKRGVSQPDPPPRLVTQVYRPDVWMVAPPRSNVIFPELYSQFSYSRNFLNEVSRLLLRTSEAFYGSDMLFDGFYMAPSRLLGTKTDRDIAAGRVGVEPPHHSDAPAWIIKDMLEHELFTGIVPSFERMNDINLHALKGGHVQEGKAGPRLDYAQLTCNHIFFGYRYKARELVASGRFNPYAVLGFPLVIIDRYNSDDAIRGSYDPKTAKSLATAFANLPATESKNVMEMNATKIKTLQAEITKERPSSHYLGTPELITHSISAGQGGTTQYQMSYARTTNDKTEFLGDNAYTVAKRQKNFVKTSVVAALKAPEEGSSGINGGKITKVTEVTDRYRRAKPKKGLKEDNAKAYGTPLPLLIGGKGYTGRTGKGTRVPVGVTLPARSYGPEVMAIAGSAGRSAAARNVLVTFLAFEIVEDCGQFLAEQRNIPPEDLVFPPWYGEQYRTANIGGLYSQLFGTGSVVDPTVVLGVNALARMAEQREKGERTLEMQLVKSVGMQLPTPGTSSTPEPPGGGQVGAPGAAEPKELDQLGEIEGRSEIAKAVDELVRIYSAVRTLSYDTPAFVQNYTWRPIASMVDLFGTADLQISDDGIVTAGREGFHSRAFGPYDDLRQLAPIGANGMPQRVLGLEAKASEVAKDAFDPSAKIAARMDTRKEKQLPVLRYLTALAASRGVLLG